MIHRDRMDSPISVGAGESGAFSMRSMPATKRLFDVLIASLCLVLVSPLMAAVAVMVRATSPGPALFRQARIGRGGRRFVLYKFRTMFDGSPNEIHREYVSKLLTDDRPPTGGRHGLYKLEDDPRVTPIGRLLRRTSIDELPQLFNVLRGDMSLVGPRPVLPWEAELIGATHAKRFLATPGITGLWQVSGRSDVSYGQRVHMDSWYVRNWSLWHDIAILFKTIPALLNRNGAY